MQAHLHFLRLYSATCTHTCKLYCIRTGIRTLHTWTRRARKCSCSAGCACQSLCSARAPRLMPAANPRAPAAAKLAVATISSTTALPLRPLYPVHAIRRRAKTAWPASQWSSCARALSSNTTSLCVACNAMLLVRVLTNHIFLSCAVRVASRQHLLFNHSSLLLRERDTRSFLVHQPKAQSEGDEPEKSPRANSGEDLFCVAFGWGGICFSFGTHYNARVVARRLPISFWSVSYLSASIS